MKNGFRAKKVKEEIKEETSENICKEEIRQRMGQGGVGKLRRKGRKQKFCEQSKKQNKKKEKRKHSSSVNE